MAPRSVGAVAAHDHELLLFFTLLELCLIVLAGRLGGTAAVRCGQARAVGEIVIGILLGPSLFGWLAPRAFDFVFHSAPPEPLLVLSQIGLVLLMFQIGLEFDFSQLEARANRTAVMRVAGACLLAPFAGGLAVGWQLAGASTAPGLRLDTALFVATAFSITALPILGRIMIDFDLTRTRLGVVAIASAGINDVVGWLLLALVTALTMSRFSASGFALRAVLVLLFGVACARGVRPLLKLIIRRSGSAADPLSANLLGLILVVIFAAAMTTYLIGIFAIFGGFMVGVVLFDEHRLVAAWRDRVGHFVTVFFLPIFFTYTGLRTAIGGLDTAQDWLWCAVVLLVASGTKLAGGYLAARSVGFDHGEAAAMGFMMNTRALMELIVINVGLDLGVITPKVFTMLVIMAVASTLMTTPALQRLRRRRRAHPAAVDAPPSPSR